MSPKLQCVVGGIMVALAWPWVALFTAATVDAQCIQDCNTIDSGACTGSSSGSCPDCIVGGACSGAPGLTFYTGTAAYGSIMGTKTVTFTAVPCQMKQPCLAGNPAAGSCSVGIGAHCDPAGFGGCTTCTLGTPFVFSTYQQCSAAACGGGGPPGGY